MPAMRVHELAKEFGMTSKELLDRLAELRIPAKNHASTLVDAYVDTRAVQRVDDPVEEGGEAGAVGTDEDPRVLRQ